MKIHEFRATNDTILARDFQERQLLNSALRRQ